MSKRVRTIDLGRFKNALLTGIKEVMDKEFLPEVVIPEVKELVQELFDKTVRSWEGGSGAPGISETTHTESDLPELKFEVKKLRFGVEITAYVESYIWNLLDQGRAKRITKKAEVFVPRTAQRTIPGTLSVGDSRQYKEKVFVPEGTTIREIAPRSWSELIAEEVENQLGRKYPNISFSISLKEQRLG